MSKFDKKRQGKVNAIISEIQEFMFEFGMTLTDDKSSMLSYFSAVICQLDTDIAIEVMEHFGVEGKHQAKAIKINYGY